MYRKLTEEDVRAIRREYAAGTLQRVLARKYCVSRENISLIVNRRTWKDVKW